MKTRLSLMLAIATMATVCGFTKVCFAQIKTNPFGATFNYDPPDTTLPERYERKDLFRLEWGDKPGQIGNKLEYNCSPGGIAVDKKGYIYILDYINSRINKYDQKGNYIKQINIRYKNKKLYETIEDIGRALPMSKVNFLGLTNDGIFLIYSHNGKIYSFNKKGVCIKEYAMKSHPPKVGIAMAYRNGGFEKEIFIHSFTENGSIIKCITKNNDTTMNYVFEAPKWSDTSKSLLKPIYGGYEVLYYDDYGNKYMNERVIENLTLDRIKIKDIARTYSMLNKYDKNNNLIAQIQIIEDSRFHITPDGDIYALYSEILSDKGPIIAKWTVKDKE